MVVVVVGKTVVVVVVGRAERRQTRRFPTAVHRNEPTDIFRICPILLQFVPPIDADWFTLCEKVTGTCGLKSISGAVIGKIPVSAAAPTEIVWHTIHISTNDGTYASNTLANSLGIAS